MAGETERDTGAGDAGEEKGPRPHDEFDWFGPAETDELTRRLVVAGAGARLEVRDDGKGGKKLRVFAKQGYRVLGADGSVDDVNNSAHCPIFCP